MQYFVYILRCADGSFYIGHSRDLAARLATHHAGRGALYCARRRPVVLAYAEPAASLRAAVRREKQLKGWTRRKKLALVQGRLRELGRE